MEPGPHVQACQRRCVEAMIDHLTAQREDLFWELAEEMYADPTDAIFSYRPVDLGEARSSLGREVGSARP